jgi:hypothetical protein
LARAARGSDVKAMLAEARRSSARIEAERAPWALGIARGLSAGVASIEDDAARALALYEEAETIFAQHHLELGAAAAAAARGRPRPIAQPISPRGLWAHLPGRWEPVK